MRICFPTFWERAKIVVSQFLYWILFPFGFRYYYSQWRSIDSWDIVIINFDPTNCIWWKSKVTSYGAEFHNYAKSFTLWSLCTNLCVISRLKSFYDKVNLCPIELNSTTKWNLLRFTRWFLCRNICISPWQTLILIKSKVASIWTEFYK